jgi:hypothetical protein
MIIAGILSEVRETDAAEGPAVAFEPNAPGLLIHENS